MSPSTPHLPRLPRPSADELSARSELTAARRRVLETVEASDAPLKATEVADALDLHHNTVREHLEALVGDGFVTVTTESTGRRGRPALRYTAAVADPAQVLNHYLTLLDAVVETLGDGSEGRAAAYAIGRRWAQLTPPAVALEVVGTASSLAQRTASRLPDLTLMGFAPDTNGEDIVLRACPLVSSDRMPHPLVCTMHEGFLNEVYARTAPGPGAADAATPSERTRLRILPMTKDGCRVRTVSEDTDRLAPESA